MASPQKEHGYTVIANEIMDHLCFPGINGSEYRVLLFVIRKTYGFNKKSDRISLSQFQIATGMKRNHVVDNIAQLVHKRVLLKKNSIYGLNKDYDTWVVHKRVPSTQKGTVASTQKGVKSSTQKGTHKRKKETITKESSKTVVLQGKQWNELIDSFKSVNPMYLDFYRNKTERAALDKLAGRIGFEKLKNTILQLEEITSRPYAPKITTPVELKRDLGKLITFYKQENSKVSPNKELI